VKFITPETHRIIVGDVLATPAQTEAKEHLEATAKQLERIDGDADKGIKAKKVPTGSKDSLGYRWKRFYGDFLSYYAKIQEEGINSLSADNVLANSKMYREKGDGFAGELKAAGVDVGPAPPEPGKPPPLIPDIPVEVKLGAGAGLAVGAVLLVLLLSRRAK